MRPKRIKDIVVGQGLREQSINTEIVRQRLEESPRKSTRCLSEGDCPLKDHSQTHTEHRSLFLSLQSSDFTNSLILNVGLMFLITNL